MTAPTTAPAHRRNASQLQPGDKARARVVRKLEFRAGDGPMIQVYPDYQLELERAPQSVVLSWQEDGQPMNAAIPVLEFDNFVAAGQVVIDA
jgi:hypothetical protein